MQNNADDVHWASLLDFAMMQRNEDHHSDKRLPHLESVVRLSNIPLVESGWNYAGYIYSRIKNSNSLVQWTLSTAEVSLNTAVETTLPSATSILNGPINVLDRIVCKSLDIMEERVPSIYLPPQMMYWQTKQYVSSKFVRPVLKRADSVKQIGNSVLASKYTAYAADTLDNALNVADKYMDLYLPDTADQTQDEADTAKSSVMDGPAGKAVQTIHHVDRFSRKLQRRLTRRTLLEAKALKDRSTESIHVLLYVAELLATDPKMAYVKARELWTSLSEDEPENQARPATLEQLIVMLTRESARRVVHLVNHTRSVVSNLPYTISKSVRFTTKQCVRVLDSLLKTVHLESIRDATVNGAKVRTRHVSVVVQQLNTFTTVLLERLALAIAGSKKTRRSSRHHRNNHHHHPSVSASPGIGRHQFHHRGSTTAHHRHISSHLNNGASQTQ